MQSDNSNTTFKLAVDYVNHTASHIFLTGKAGTGKTTFLKYIRQNSHKKMAVVAPTGVAAINAGGVTIHSLLQLPFGTFLPTRKHIWNTYDGHVNSEHTLLSNLRFSRPKIDLLRELDLLIIDEVSMVRADCLDMVDTVLRHVRRQPLIPFGGVQVLYIGDLFQLPPVVRNEEWQLMSEYYNGVFFFHSRAIQQSPPVIIELNKVYRQSDDLFISLLNRIRNNDTSPNDLALLNGYYNPHFNPSKADGYITLTTHNNKALAINERELANLPGKTWSFKAEVQRDFPEHLYPMEQVLHLKEGAQVMFIKNDKGEDRRYYNGKITTIKSINEDKIVVANEGEDDIELVKETWRNIRYNYDSEEDEIKEDELGVFSQYPIRLAWAITIHKSQGLTFEKAVIDCGDAFAPGQVYVALSRLTSLKGLVLKSKIPASGILAYPDVTNFLSAVKVETDLQKQLAVEKESYTRQSLFKAFDFSGMVYTVEQHHASYQNRKLKDKEAAIAWAAGLIKEAETLQEVGNKFRILLDKLFVTNDLPHIYARTKAACKHFTNEINDKLLRSVIDHRKSLNKADKVKKYLKHLGALEGLFGRVISSLEHIEKVVTSPGTDSSVDLSGIIAKKKMAPAASSHSTRPIKAAKGDTYKITYDLYKQGKTIKQIAEERNLVVSTIEGHLASFIASGQLDVHELISENKLMKVLDALNKAPEIPNLTELKREVGSDFSFGEIKAALAYHQYNKSLAQA